MAKPLRLILLLAGVVGGIVALRENDVPRASSSPIADQAIVTASASLKETPQVRAQKNWSEFSVSLKDVDSLSQGELDALYDEAKALIQKDPKGIWNQLRQGMPSMIQGEVAYALFTIGSWMRYSDDPLKMIDLLAIQEVSQENPSSHHVVSTPALKLQQMKSYAVRELGKKVQEGPMSAEDQSAVVSKLLSLSKNERSLDVALEIFPVLKALDERDAINDGLANYSARDRDLISQTINLR